jgi:hypothetical protein
VGVSPGKKWREEEKGGDDGLLAPFGVVQWREPLAGGFGLGVPRGGGEGRGGAPTRCRVALPRPERGGGGSPVAPKQGKNKRWGGGETLMHGPPGTALEARVKRF